MSVGILMEGNLEYQLEMGEAFRWIRETAAKLQEWWIDLGFVREGLLVPSTT